MLFLGSLRRIRAIAPLNRGAALICRFSPVPRQKIDLVTLFPRKIKETGPSILFAAVHAVALHVQPIFFSVACGFSCVLFLSPDLERAGWRRHARLRTLGGKRWWVDGLGWLLRTQRDREHALAEERWWRDVLRSPL
ncbi:hypothetical protein K432DRAFT_172794 [Lepidopterella palustris CBS 459.81]|uniref:Uncharacterized protein n=1 Tax=Lepidopterella palustris CBS 459.81 TaxID=1314670 RepID=A0A8E2E156_9PEZI|nr:hypothetical protein K432DRAFT_172794 [Lepidopterella palustris CBS 459.81]